MRERFSREFAKFQTEIWWTVKIKADEELRVDGGVVNHPLSRSHDFCMTGLCIWVLGTLPFVFGGRPTEPAQSLFSPFARPSLRSARGQEHIHPIHPFLSLCSWAEARLCHFLRSDRPRSETLRIVCFRQQWVRQGNVPPSASRFL